ncbi:MAG: serine/threonine protein kinase [Labilithrix sp.]|nr:serine/threonine protein kinase [Labilithrix sp.]
MQGPGKTQRMAHAALVTVRAPPNVKPGTMIGEKYRVEREIGRGGFGVVVRAMHLTLDQRVAIKVLTEGEGTTDLEWAEDAARFRREAKATAALRSEHVVRVLDVDVLESGYPYIVMEYLEGKTLHDLTYTAPAPLPVEDVVDYGIQVLAALADAHAAGIVHRDLKPANVFLSTGIGGAPLVKVLDFGVSKMLAASSQRLTRTGAVVGTLAYMAPEQMLDAKRVDGRADLWSLALVLYEALARAHPFGAHTAGPKVVTSILTEPIPPIRSYRADVPPALEAALLRMLEKPADLRFGSAIEAAAALAPFSSPRSRPVLDEIRRAAPPSGHAAPGFVSARGAPPSTSTSAPGRATSAARGKPMSPLVGFLLAFVIAVLVLGLVAAFVFYVQPRLSASAAVAAPSESTTSEAVASASASALSAVSVTPATRPLDSSERSSPPALSAPSRHAAPANPCDPPFVFDPETNVKRYKTECL